MAATIKKNKSGKYLHKVRQNLTHTEKKYDEKHLVLEMDFSSSSHWLDFLFSFLGPPIPFDGFAFYTYVFLFICHRLSYVCDV